MSTINRSQFMKEFSKSGINVNDMTPETRAKLAKAGVSEAELAKIAGKDGQISGQAEYNKLFKIVDSFDKNGSANSFEAKDSAGVETKSGAVYEALKSEIDRNASKARMQGVIHLGMRKESVHEANALEKSNPKSDGGVTRIKAYESEGKINYEGKDFDLKTNAGLDAYRDALKTGPDKMSDKQAQDFVNTLKGVKKESRDEMAQLGLNFYRAGEGKLPVNRLVLSGHGMNGEISGDDQGLFHLKDVEKLANVFPKGAAKIEHVAVSACFCAGEETFATLRSAFPNLKSAFAYNEFSPKAESGAPSHLKKWESMTDGEDPSQVDPPFAKTATWNSVDGTQGLPKIPLSEAEQNAKDKEPAFEAYKTGGKDPKLGTSDRQLNEYYARLLDLLRHPDITPQRKAEVEARRQEVFKLRHPELVR
jgi:hypothetical protein